MITQCFAIQEIYPYIGLGVIYYFLNLVYSSFTEGIYMRSTKTNHLKRCIFKDYRP